MNYQIHSQKIVVNPPGSIFNFSKIVTYHNYRCVVHMNALTNYILYLQTQDLMQKYYLFSYYVDLKKMYTPHQIPYSTSKYQLSYLI